MSKKSKSPNKSPIFWGLQVLTQEYPASKTQFQLRKHFQPFAQPMSSLHANQQPEEWSFPAKKLCKGALFREESLLPRLRPSSTNLLSSKKQLAKHHQKQQSYIDSICSQTRRTQKKRTPGQKGALDQQLLDIFDGLCKTLLDSRRISIIFDN